MADDALLTTLPHELEIADNGLREVLERELARTRVPGSSILNFQRPKAVRSQANRYLDELFRVEGGRAELVRRLMVIPRMTAEGTEFADALADLKKSTDRWRGRLERHCPGHVVRGIRGHVKRLSDGPTIEDIEGLRGRIETLLEQVPSTRILSEKTQRKLLRTKCAADAVWHEAERSEVEGCQLLLLWGSNLSPDGVDDQLRALLESNFSRFDHALRQCDVRTTAERMDKGRASLTKWVEREAKRPEVQPLVEARASASENALFSSEADRSAFRPATELYQQRKLTHAQGNRFLKQHPEIHTDKPSSQRLLIHSGHWNQYWAEYDRTQSEALDDEAIAERIADIEARKEDERQRK